MKNIQKLLLAASICGLSQVAQAGSTTWDWDLQTHTSTSLNVVGTNTNDATTLNGELTAFADTGGVNDNILEQGYLAAYGSGFGMRNAGGEWRSPAHAFDNTRSNYTCPDGQVVYDGNCYTYNGPGDYTQATSNSQFSHVGAATYSLGADYDMALVSFDTSVELTEVGFSWTANSTTDFTVLAYTGSAATPALAGNTWAGISSDWTVVGSYSATGSGYYEINSAGTTAQHWLVGAYNDILHSGYTNDTHDVDAFKLQGLKGRTTVNDPGPAPKPVPEPTAFGFLLLGMLGIYARRNKKSL